MATPAPAATPIVDMIVGANGAGWTETVLLRSLGRSVQPFRKFRREGPTSGLKIADLDNDGDLDMVETMRGDGTPGSGTNIVYVNATARCRACSKTSNRSMARRHDRSSGVVIGDVNGDTKLDVVISNETTGGHDVAAAESNELPVSQHDDRAQ